MGDDEFVQPSGKVTDTGEPIYEAKPTATTVQQQVSEGRVQTFGSGGGKISDTQRVAVTSGGETKWVTPEKAKFQSAKGTLKFKEAEKKIKAKEELRETIKQRITKQQKPSILKEREEPIFFKQAPPTRKEIILKPIKTKRTDTKIITSDLSTDTGFVSKPLFPAILAVEEGIKEKKRKRLIMDRPDLFPELFGLVREKTVSRPASKITIEQKEFGPIQKLKSTVVGKPEKVFMFTDTGLLTVPQVKHPSKKEQARQDFEEKVTGSRIGKAFIKGTGESSVRVTELIARPGVESLTTPLPQKAQFNIRDIVPPQEIVRRSGEEFATKLSLETATRLGTPKGLADTSLTIAAFTATGGVASFISKGTKFAEPVATVIKASPKILLTGLAGIRAISGGFKVAAGEEPLVALSSQAGTFGGELIAFSTVGKGLKLGVRGIKLSIPRTFQSVKLVSARERVIIGKKGQILDRAFETETTLSKPFKSYRTPKTKPVRVEFTKVAEVRGPGKTPNIVNIIQRGVAKVSFPAGLVSQGKELPVVTVTKTISKGIEGPILTGIEPSFGQAKFPVTASYREIIPVKGFKRLQIRPSELVEVITKQIPLTTKQTAAVAVGRGKLGDVFFVDQKGFQGKLLKGEQIAGQAAWAETGPPDIFLEKRLPKTKVSSIIRQLKQGIKIKDIDTGLTIENVLKHELIHVGDKTLSEATVRSLESVPAKKLFSVGVLKTKRFPFVSAKEVNVPTSQRLGPPIKQTIVSGKPVRGKAQGFIETKFNLITPKKRVPKIPKGTPKEGKVLDLDRALSIYKQQIKPPEPKALSGYLVSKKGKLKPIVVSTDIPPSRQIALDNIARSSRQVTQSISKTTTKPTKITKPTIGLIETKRPGRTLISRVSQNVIAVPPTNRISKPTRLPRISSLGINEPEIKLQPTLLPRRQPFVDLDTIQKSVTRIIQQPDRRVKPKPDVIIIPDQEIINIPDVIKIPDITEIPDFVPPPPIYPKTPPPPPPYQKPTPGMLGFPALFLFGGKKRKRGKRQAGAFGYTADFIASIENQYGKASKKSVFTGQERRFKVKGKKFLSKLPKMKFNNMFG